MTRTSLPSEGAVGWQRLAFLHDLLELDPASTGHLRYQLFHRTAAALILAQRFGARIAMMLVHSFSPTHSSYDDCEAFSSAMGAGSDRGTLSHVGVRNGVELHLGWASGDQSFRNDIAVAKVPAASQ